MKRHEKPYGCTYEGCSKRFGSKNDWKRHENSQHFLLEIWKCDFRPSGTPTEVCGKVSHRRETFRQHLANNHGLTGDVVEKRVEECRVGRNCEANFWCGFCVEIIRIERQGIDAWTERFNHIDDHLNGRNDLPQKQMDEWKSVDPERHPLPNGAAAEVERGATPEIADTASLVSNRNRNTKNGPRDAGRVAGGKRKPESLGDSRQPKRLRHNEVRTARCVSLPIFCLADSSDRTLTRMCSANAVRVIPRMG